MLNKLSGGYIPQTTITKLEAALKDLQGLLSALGALK